MSQKEMQPEVYTQEEMEAIEAHIAKRFGAFDQVFHEIVSPDIHVDICVIQPSAERNHYTLVTMGMGAHRMNTPPELDDRKLQRAEIVVTLPADWKLQDSDEHWYWPMRWLKILARMPGEQNTWLGWGHTVENEVPVADNTELCCMMLTMPYLFGIESLKCPLPDGDEVTFYQMIPLYKEEMEYKMEHGIEALEDLFPDEFDMVVDIGRKNFAPNA